MENKELFISIDGPSEDAEFAFVVSVRTDQGQGVEGAAITMTTPEGSEIKETRTKSYLKSTDWRTTFTYKPTEKGVLTVTFTYGDFTKEVVINNQ